MTDNGRGVRRRGRNGRPAGVLLCVFLATQTIAAGAWNTRGVEKTYSDRSNTGSIGEVVIGSKGTLVVKDLNPWRYDYKIKRAFTKTDGPDILGTLKFLPKEVPAPSTEKVPKPGKGADVKSEEFGILGLESKEAASNRLDEFAGKLDNLSQEVATAVGLANTLQNDTAAAAAELRAFVSTAGAYPDYEKAKNRAVELVSKVKAKGTPPSWPHTAGLKSELERLKAELDIVKLLIKLEDRLEAVQAYKSRFDTIEKSFSELDNVESEWRAARQDSEAVAARLEAVSKSDKAATLEEVVTCGSPGETALTLVKTDLLPPLDAKPDHKPTSEEKPMVTFVCTHPITLSAGVFFSNLDQREYAFVPTQVPNPGGEGSVQQAAVGFTGKSNLRPMPGVLVHARLLALSPDFAVHASFGPMLDFGGQQGNDLEFLVGPSISIRRDWMITAGAHIGRTAEPQSGFTVGSPQPQGVTDVPVSKRYNVGFGVGVSFRFK